MDDISTYVQRYLARGWALVPLHAMIDGHCTCGRDCGKSAGKHPMWPRWTEQTVRNLLDWKHPRANIGVATGAPSGFWVLDYDPASAAPMVNGQRTAVDLVHILIHDAEMPPHVTTGGGGWHWRFRMPADFEPTNRRGSLPAGLDVRGTGGQVVAPPSVSGKGPYVELTDAEPYDPPGWLLDMIRPAEPRGLSADGRPPAGWSPLAASPGHTADDRGQRYAAGALPAILSELAYATEGTRNDTAFRTAARLIELMNASWLPPGVEGEWTAAGMHSGLGGVELAQVWGSALRHVGTEMATLPPEWTDPTRGEVWTPPVIQGVPPFPSADPPTGTEALPSTGVADAWEQAVAREVSRELVRREARRRVVELDAGSVGAVADRIDAEFLDVAGVLALPALEPLVDGVLFLDTLARINGPSGHGKSFVALDLAARVSRGMTWAGRPTRQVRVDYVVAEGARGVGKRIAAWQAAHGALDGAWVRFLPRPVQILGPEWAGFVESCRRRGTGLVVVDTQARATEGVDEKDRVDMSNVVAAAEQLRRATGACVLLVHHTPQTGDDGRGHTEVKGALQSEMLVRKSDRIITVKSRKQKDDDDFAPIEFELTDVKPVPVEGLPAFVGDTVGVVPTWRGESKADAERPYETARVTRARQLWSVIHRRFNPGMGGTYAECRQAFRDEIGWNKPDNATLRAAWSHAWADLIQLGLLAKSYGAGRFKVVVLDDQSADGVLTSNRNGDQLVSEGPVGFEVLMTDIPRAAKDALLREGVA